MISFILTIEDDSDRKKIEDLYERYHQSMYYTAMNILKDGAKAEDVVSTAFIRVIENLKKIEIPDPPGARAFLNVITRNIAIDMLRRAGKEMPWEEEYDEIIPSKDEPVESKLECEEMKRVFQASLQKMPEIYRDILYMKIMWDYSEDAICRILQITETNYRTRLCRARQYAMKYMTGGQANEQ